MKTTDLPKNAHRNARNRKAWIDRRKEIVTDESSCNVCGRSAKEAVLQIHHTSKDAYKRENFHLYETLSPLLPFILICRTCHFASHQGLDLCPICKKHYKVFYRPHCILCATEKGEINRCKCGAYKIAEKPFCWGDFCYKDITGGIL